MPAVCIVTVVAVGTLTTGAVSLAAHSDVARVLIQLVVLLSGFVLWAPVLTELPGSQPLSALGRGGYLIVQSIVPSFLSMVWIFARHSLYASYDHHVKVLGMTPLLDQQLAGFLAKLSTIAVLWTVAFILMTRAQVTATSDEDADPLMWSDVEREIERADRRDRAPAGPRRRYPCQKRRRPVTPPRIQTSAPTATATERGPAPRSGQRSSPEIIERQFGCLVATALRALLDVAPRPEQAGPLGVQQHDERLGDGVDLQAEVGAPAPSSRRGRPAPVP